MGELVAIKRQDEYEVIYAEEVLCGLDELNGVGGAAPVELINYH